MGEQEVGTVQEKAVLSQVLLEQVGANIFIGWSTQVDGHAVQHVYACTVGQAVGQHPP